MRSEEFVVRTTVTPELSFWIEVITTSDSFVPRHSEKIRRSPFSDFLSAYMGTRLKIRERSCEINKIREKSCEINKIREKSCEINKIREMEQG